MALLHSNRLYITLPWLYFTLLDSTILYLGSTSLYFTLHYSMKEHFLKFVYSTHALDQTGKPLSNLLTDAMSRRRKGSTGSERYNIKCSHHWFYQLLEEWEEQLQPFTKDWLLCWVRKGMFPTAKWLVGYAAAWASVWWEHQYVNQRSQIFYY